MLQAVKAIWNILKQIAIDIYNCFDGWSNISAFWGIVSSIVMPIGIYIYISLSKKKLYKFLPEKDIQDLKYYVPTKFQHTDPCIELDFNNINSSVQIDLIKYFKKEFKQNKKGKLFLILADSGMGKTIFLHKLYVKYKRHFFWRNRIHLIPLTNERDINEIKKIENQSEKILLLDALDEDSYAIKNRESRINELVVNTQDFYKVIITCRTQFFPDSKSEPENTNLIRYGTQSKKYKFTKLYISPFSDQTIQKYLKKKFRFSKSKRKCAEKIVKKSPNLMARPMLLGYIDNLLKKEEYENISDIYSYLVKQWIEDKENIDEQILSEFVHNTVCYLFEHNKLSLAEEEIKKLCNDTMRQKLDPDLARSRSLLNRNKHEYKFAHKSIYEYLISKEALDNPDLRKPLLDKIKNKEITDIFYTELCTKFIQSAHLNEYCNLDLSYMIIRNLKCKHLEYFTLNANFEGSDLFGEDLENLKFVQTNLKKAFLVSANLTGADLSCANLSGANLTDANLFSADLSGADLRGANFTGTNLEGSNLKYATLKLAYHDSPNFENANLKRADLSGVDLSFANLKGADLRNSFLQGANLIGVDLTDADLSGASFTNFYLAGAILKGTNLTGVDFTGADLSGASFTNAYLAGAILKETNLTGVDFTGANLCFANLKEINLKDGNLSSADLSGADLSSADLSGADLSGTNFTGANLEGSNLKYATLEWADFKNANLKRADLSNMDLSGADLSGANFTGANLEGSSLKYITIKHYHSPNFENANLKVVHFKPNFENANLKRADLSGINLSFANLKGADLRNSFLQGTNLIGADLIGADLTGANLKNVII